MTVVVVEDLVLVTVMIIIS